MNSTLHTSDCLSLLRTLPDDSIDNIITDPPYALGFMGKQWDASLPTLAIWQECLRVAKPGAHLLSFGSPRTYHRLTCAIEDAGWEVVDCVMWMHGQGFPKGQSQLKPAYEPIVLARKKASHVRPLNIDACRIPTDDIWAGNKDNAHTNYSGKIYSAFGRQYAKPSNALGRWPANVILDEQAGRMLDAQTGLQKSGVAVQRNGGGQKMTDRVYAGGRKGGMMRDDMGYGDTGGASRFFYCPKASKSEREQGCERLPLTKAGNYEDDAYVWPDGTHHTHSRNTHPTVKPLALMRYLTRLVACSGSVILDPFLGSGTTGMAAAHEQCHFIGCDTNPEYVTIAHCRIDPIVSASLI